MSSDGRGVYEAAGVADDGARIEELFPMCSWGLRQRRSQEVAGEQAGESSDSPLNAEGEVKYFGALTCCQKIAFGLPNVGYYSMKFMVASFVKVFYTDDYPRVNLSGIALVAALQILVDVIFDPLVASWSDNLRGKLFGCIPVSGRRKPFILISSILGVLAFFGLWYPPPSLSASVPEEELPGLHQYWRIVDTDNLATWKVREVEFFSQPNTLSDSQVLGGIPLAQSAHAFDGDESTWAATAGKNFGATPVQVLAVKVLQFADDTASGYGLLQFSDDGTNWVEAYDISNGLDTTGEWGVGGVHYNSMGSLFWYAAFIIFFKVVVVTMREIPFEALPAEMTPDSGQRSSLFSVWAIGQVLGTLIGAVLPSFHYMGPTCSGTAFDGCYQYVAIGTVLASFHFLCILGTSSILKERKVGTLPPPEPLSITVMLVQTWMNQPFRILLVSDILEGFGAEVPMAVLPYMVKWVIGSDIIEAQLGMSWSMFFAVNAGIHLLTKVPFTLLWRCIVTKMGKYKAFLFVNVVFVIQSILFFFIGRESGVYYCFIMMITWSFATSGFWVMRSMLTDVIDYDEFLGGQRREAQYMMLVDLLPKFTELPGITLPFLFMAKFGYNPSLAPVDMPAGVIWTLRLSFSIVPALFTLLGLVVLRMYPIKTEAQVEALQEALEAHRKGLACKDPLCEDSVVPPTMFLEEAGKIQFAGRVITKKNSLILQNFFPSELQAALEAEDLGVLQWKQLWPVCLSILLIPVGVVLMILGWGDLGSKLGASVTPIGLMMLGLGIYLLAFTAVRLCKAREAISLDIPFADVETQLAMYEPFLRSAGDMDSDEEDDDSEEYESES